MRLLFLFLIVILGINLFVPGTFLEVIEAPVKIWDFGPEFLPTHEVESTIVYQPSQRDTAKLGINYSPGVNEKRSIALHFTANYNDYADGPWHGIYQDTTHRKVSWPYSVDQNQITQHFDDDVICWHAQNCNYESIGVEVCYWPGASIEKTLDNLSMLLDTLESRYPGIEIIKHSDCTNKNCPSWPVLKYYHAEARHDPIYDFDKVNEYISKYTGLALIEEQEAGIPAAITMAQGILESNVGLSRLAREANNHFGVKKGGSWNGPVMMYADDKPNDLFRIYSIVGDSYADHTQVLLKDRYSSLFKLNKADYEGWAHGLKRCGYATNEIYAEILLGIIYRFELHKKVSLNQ